MAEFRLRFTCKGDRRVKKDVTGDEIVQLRSIEDKYYYPQEDCLVFGVIWWEREESQDCIRPVKVSQLKKDYPLQVQEWEDTFGNNWESANLIEEKVWIPDFNDPSENLPRSKERGATSTVRATSAKRQYQDTPNKARQDPTKKLRTARDASDDQEEEEADVSENDQDKDSDDVGLVKKPRDIVDLPSDDSPERLPLSRGLKTFLFQLSKRQSPGKNKFQRLVKSSAPDRARQPARTSTKSRTGASTSKQLAPEDTDESEEEESTEQSSEDQVLPKLKGQASANPFVTSGYVGPSGHNKSPPRRMTAPKFAAPRGLGSPVSKRGNISGHQMILTSRPAPGSSPTKTPQSVHFQIDEESDEEDSSKAPSPDDTPRRYGMPGRDTQISDDENDTRDQESDIGIPQSPEKNDEQQLCRHPGDGSEDGDQPPRSQQVSPMANRSNLHGHPSQQTGQDLLEDENAQPRSQLESPARGPSFFSDFQEGAEIAFAESQFEQEGLGLDEEPPVQPTQIRADGEDSVYNRYSELLIHALDQGVDSLIMMAMDMTGMPCDGWVAKRKSSKVCQYRDLLHSLWLMVISWDPLVLKHVVHGNLPEEENRNPELKKALRAMNENLPKTKACPSTYANYLVDKEGVATTVDGLKMILDISELYLGGLAKPDDDSGSHEVAAKVDSALPSKTWGPRSAKEGKRRYIESDTQAAKCMEWIENSRERLRGLPDDEPLARPLCEVGFAKTPHERLAQHAAHTSSNYLMNLAEAICMAHDRLSKYRIKQYVVHHLAHHTHAMYDEILASRFALVYTNQGGGFSHYPAGISHKGAEHTEKEHYNAQQQLMARDPNFSKRISEQIDKMRTIAKFYKEFVDVSNQHVESIKRIALAAKALDEKCDEVLEQQDKERRAWAALTDPIYDFMDFADELEKDMEDEDV